MRSFVRARLKTRWAAVVLLSREEGFAHLGEVDILRVDGGLLANTLQKSVGNVERLQDELAH